MKSNKITVIINKPIAVVFDFTTDPKNTHLWIPSIQEEVSDEFPPKIGTRYKNRGKNLDWNFYKVVDYQPNRTFTLSDLNRNLYVKYTYKKLGDNQTKMEYFEWVETGELENPFNVGIFQNLKVVLEKR
ncbi:MAG: SRPBCC family protein [archaeon]